MVAKSLSSVNLSPSISYKELLEPLVQQVQILSMLVQPFTLRHMYGAAQGSSEWLLHRDRRVQARNI